MQPVFNFPAQIYRQGIFCKISVFGRPRGWRSGKSGFCQHLHEPAGSAGCPARHSTSRGQRWGAGRLRFIRHGFPRWLHSLGGYLRSSKVRQHLYERMPEKKFYLVTIPFCRCLILYLFPICLVLSYATLIDSFVIVEHITQLERRDP